MTDHAAEARGNLVWADSYQEGPEVRLAMYMAARAQVHATLALAEEQRTANLIAWLAFRSTDGIVASDTDVFLDVAARLGLTTTTTTPKQEQNR